MDYKEPIEQLKNIRFLYADDGLKCASICKDAATAIETLLAERDAAIEFLKSTKNRCGSCAYNYHSVYDYPCKHCKETGGMSDYWKWRGPQKEGSQDDQQR